MLQRMNHPLLSFTARVVSGSGRGKDIGAATMNVDLSDVPKDLEEGIFAVMVNVDGKDLKAAMHYGPRPVFQDSKSCEVHVIDEVILHAPHTIEVTIVERLRDVTDFPSKDALMEQITKDVEQARGILEAHGHSST